LKGEQFRDLVPSVGNLGSWIMVKDGKVVLIGRTPPDTSRNINPETSKD